MADSNTINDSATSRLCIRDINNSMPTISIIDITTHCAKLLWNKSIHSYKCNIDNSITINIVGDLDIEIKLPHGQSDITSVAIYCSVLGMWAHENRCDYGSESIKLIKSKVEEIRKCNSTFTARDCATSLAKLIRKYNTCNGTCTTVTPNKNQGKCTFKLSDIDTLCKFTAEGIIDVFNSIAWIYMEDSSICGFVDINNTYVSCDGNIYSGVYTNAKGNPVAEIKRMYTEYVSSWCSHNYTKTADRDKLILSIGFIESSSTSDEIYYMTNDLLDSL